MNDAGNQYLGVGVEIWAMVAAVASLAAQEAEAAWEERDRGRSVVHPPLHFTASPYCPQSAFLSPSHSSLASPCGGAQGA